MSDRTVTVFGGTGFLGRRVVWHLRKREFSVRIASRHPERGKKLFGTDDPQLQSFEAGIHDERSIADVLAGAFGVVNAVSLYVEHEQQTFIPYTSRPPSGWQVKHTEPASNDSPTSQKSAPMLHRHRSISASVVKANWHSERRFPMQFSSVQR